jgi:hypothetical protein
VGVRDTNGNSVVSAAIFAAAQLTLQYVTSAGLVSSIVAEKVDLDPISE